MDRSLFSRLIESMWQMDAMVRREREVKELARGIAESEQFSTEAAYADFVTNLLCPKQSGD